MKTKNPLYALPELFAASGDPDITLYTEINGFGTCKGEGDSFLQLVSYDGEYPWRVVLEARSGDKSVCDLYVRLPNGLYRLDRSSRHSPNAAFRHHDNYVASLVREAEERAIYSLASRFHMTEQRA